MATVVVGVDDCDGARRALEWALRYAAKVGADVVAANANDLRLDSMDAAARRVEGRVADARERSLRLVADVVADVKSAVDVRAVTVEALDGDPSRALVDRSATADLLVVGARGRGGITGLLLGSVSQRCVQGARCPVVVVRGWPRTG